MPDKPLQLVGGAITQVEAKNSSAGAGDAGKIVALDAAGRISDTMMPTGIGADTASVACTEDLAAGDLVNTYNSSGGKCRKADASTAGKEAHGFVKSSYTSGQTAVIYYEGNNDQVTGLTPGVQYLSTTPGLTTHTAPSSSGNIVQRVGFASAATNLNFQSQTPVALS